MTVVFVTAAPFLSGAGSLRAQTAGNPLVPRGSLVFRVEPSGTTVEGVYGASGSEDDLGEAFRFSELGVEEIPSLGPVGERFEDLARATEPSGLRLGATTARFSLDERALPLHLSYGLFERLTVGVTVPFVRREVEPFVRLGPDGANVGRNPASTAAGDVAGFLGEAKGSLSALQVEVDDRCNVVGESAPECQEGRDLVSDTGRFLDALSGAYDEEPIFPLEGSAFGAGITSRWGGLTARFADWDTGAPQAGVPLASGALSQDQFEALYIAPVWGSGGFPLDSGEPVLALGDIEAHVAVGLLRPEDLGAPGAEVSASGGEGLRVVASAVGSIRMGTGTPDSLRIVAPLHPSRGVSGFGLGVVTDVLLPGRFAILATLEGGWNGSAETTLLVSDPETLFRPGFNRRDVRWSPGSHVRAGLTPRFRVAPGLSIGGGWYLLDKQADEYEAIDSDDGASGPALPLSGKAYTQHRLGLELRYVAMRPPLADEVPFPFEILLRTSRTISGSHGAPVETKAEAMVRFRLRDW